MYMASCHVRVNVTSPYTVFSNTRSYGVMKMTGNDASTSAIGPCFRSPAA
jgi:hypothetical protein